MEAHSGHETLDMYVKNVTFKLRKPLYKNENSLIKSLFFALSLHFAPEKDWIKSQFCSGPLILGGMLRVLATPELCI